MLELTPTLVDYPSGGLHGTGTVLISRPVGARTAVVVDRTPFHPVDHGWPDQGPDRGTLTVDGHAHDVVDCVLGATDGTDLFVGQDIPVRRGTEGWAFLVVHLLDGAIEIPVGSAVELAVDAERRRVLSAGHTACHVASLALNAALAQRWTKPVTTDGLGHPDFDKLALATSVIGENGAVDTYRLGKSLRKKGFDAAELDAALPQLQADVDAILAGWVAAGGRIAVEVAGPALTDLREWVCTTPEGQVRIACGGTHLDELSAFGSITVRLALEPEQLVLTTTATVTDA